MVNKKNSYGHGDSARLEPWLFSNVPVNMNDILPCLNGIFLLNFQSYIVHVQLRSAFNHVNLSGSSLEVIYRW